MAASQISTPPNQQPIDPCSPNNHRTNHALPEHTLAAASLTALAVAVEASLMAEALVWTMIWMESAGQRVHRKQVSTTLQRQTSTSSGACLWAHGCALGTISEYKQAHIRGF